MSNPKRKQILINRPFQLHFCLFTCAWMLALCALAPIVAAKTFAFLIQDLTPSLSGLELIAVDEMRHRILTVLIIFQMLALVLSFLFCLYLSHRIAGPIYRLNETLKSIREGKIPGPVRFRKYDYFLDLQESMNLTLAQLHERSGISVKTLSEIEAQISHALPHANPEARSDLENALRAIRESRIEAT